jgi:hypothetical protein
MFSTSELCTYTFITIPSSLIAEVFKMAETQRKIQHILGAAYIEFPRQVLQAPKSLEDPSKYGEDRLLEALEYADSTLRNPITKLPPASEHDFLIYQDCCINLLTLDEIDQSTPEKAELLEKSKKEWLETIMSFEGDMMDHSELKPAQNWEQQTLQAQTIELQRWILNSRYEGTPEHWSNIDGDYWEDIYEEVSHALGLAEDADEDVIDAYQTITNLSNTCGRIGLRLKELIENMEEYHDRTANKINLLRRLKADGTYGKLAWKLYEDYRSVPLVTSLGDEDLMNLVQSNIRAVMNLWFERDPKDPDDWEKWTPTMELISGPDTPEEQNCLDRLDRRRKARERELARQQQYPRGPRTHIHEVKYVPERSALMVFGAREYPS